VLVDGTTREVARCTTDAAGSCIFTTLDLGAYRVKAHSGRHRPKTSDSVALAERGARTRIALALEAGRSLRGRVLGPDGAPIAGAQVGSSDEGSLIATTDASGRYELSGLGDAPINVFATAAGYAPRHLRAMRPGGAGVDLVLELPATVSGSVALQATAPSLLVSICGFDTHFQKELCVSRATYHLDKPDEATSFRMQGLASGVWDVVVEADGHESTRTRVTLSAGVETTVEPMLLKAK
jgi:hypothetical protein